MVVNGLLSKKRSHIPPNGKRKSSSKKVPCGKDTLASRRIFFLEMQSRLVILRHRIHVWYIYVHKMPTNHVGKYTSSLDPNVKRPAKPRNVRFLLRYPLIELDGKWTLNEDGDFPTIKNGEYSRQLC